MSSQEEDPKVLVEATSTDVPSGSDEENLNLTVQEDPKEGPQDKKGGIKTNKKYMAALAIVVLVLLVIVLGSVLGTKQQTSQSEDGLTSSSPPNNLMYNGNFDLKLTGWRQGEQAQWTGDGFPTFGEPPAYIDDNDKPRWYGGKIGAGEDSGRLSQTVRVVPYSDYTLSAQIEVRNGKPGTAGVAVGGIVTNYNVLNATATHCFDYSGTNDDFQNVTLSFHSGADETVTVFFDAGEFGNADKAVGDLRIDTVVLSGPVPDGCVPPDSVFRWVGWELEGENPVTCQSSLHWDAVEQCALTKSGNGCRHEGKTLENVRTDIDNQFESLSYTGTIDFSNGTESVVTQWHPDGLGTLAALYITDVSENAKKFFTNDDLVNGTRWLSFSEHGGDGVPSNGVFDVIVAVRDPVLADDTLPHPRVSGVYPAKSYGGSYAENVVHLGTIRSGESFEFYGENDHGDFHFDVTIGGVTRTAQLRSSPSSTSYLKFGSYDQVRDPFTMDRILNDTQKDTLSFPEKIAVFTDWYAAHPERRSAISMTNVEHVRRVDEGAPLGKN